MIGDRFSRLVIVSELPKVQFKTTYLRQFLCKCDCGNYIKTYMSNLRRGATKSCGCLKRDTAGNSTRTHGMSSTDEYKIWAGIVKRCTNTKYREFHLYGGRGISVAPEWMSFENFYKDMGNRPSKQHSIDRIDPNGNYCKDNCQWANDVEQGLNKRKTTAIFFNKKKLSLRQFAISVSVSYFTIYDWVVRKGMNEDELLSKLSFQLGTSLEPMCLENLKIYRPIQ